MKRLTNLVIFICLFCLLSSNIVVAHSGQFRGPEIFPSIYIDFEYDAGSLNTASNPFYDLRAPGIFEQSGFVGNETIGYASVSQGTGIDGGDCLDKTNVASWGASGSVIRYGSDAVGYDDLAEASLDNMRSFTICGWVKAQASSPFGGNARLFSRLGQLQIIATSAEPGKIDLYLPADAGSNPSAITVRSGSAAYNQTDTWIFFAITYNGTITSNNVKFYKGTQTQPAYLVSTGTANAGQLKGGATKYFVIGAYSANGTSSTAGYMDKFTVFTNGNSQTSPEHARGALSLTDVENVRRWHLDLEQQYTDALTGDTDLDADVDNDDIAVVNANKDQTGPFYWSDGDFDGDLDVDQTDLNAANANYTGTLSTPSVDVAVISSMEKIRTTSDFTIVTNPTALLYAAKNERESFQLAIVPKDYRIAGIEITKGAFTHESSGIFDGNNIVISRIDKVRASVDIVNPWPDPLIAETSGNVGTGKVLSFWIDFEIANTAAAGVYKGNIYVKAPGRPDITIPVTLKVWNCYLSRNNQTIQTSFNLFRHPLRSYYGGTWNDGSDTTYRKWLDILLQRRISPTDMSMGNGYDGGANRFITVTKKTNGTWQFNFTEFDEYLDYCMSQGSSAFNAGDLYWHFYDEFWGYDEATSQWKNITDNTNAAFNSYLSQAEIHYLNTGSRPYKDFAFYYDFDELNPNDSNAMNMLTSRYDAVHDSDWSDLRTLTTSEPGRYPDYNEYVDVYVNKIPNWNTHTEPKAAIKRAQGDELWMYVTAWNPDSGYCNFSITEPAIEHRVLFWQNILKNSDGFLHWGTNVWDQFRWRDMQYAPAAYDRWPAKDWQDSSSWLDKFINGEGYLLYPGTDGPLSSIRLENIRDGIEDWEYVNLINTLIDNATGLGVRSALVSTAESSADISSVITSLTSWTSDPAVVTNKITGIAVYADLLRQEIIQKLIEYPQAYIPFENSNGTFGYGSQSNPGWRNIAPATDESIAYILPQSSPTYPRIYAGTDKIKGAYQRITGYGTPGVDAMQTHCYNGSIVTSTMSQAKSFTVTFWVNTRDASKSGSESYIFRQNGTNTPALKWRSDGRMQVLVNGTWYYSDYDCYESNNSWVFCALSVDSVADTVKFYAGTKTASVFQAGSLTGTIAQLPSLNSGNYFVLNGYSYNGSDKYAGYDLDEFRIYSSSADSSGALDMEKIERLRLYDVMKTPKSYISFEASNGAAGDGSESNPGWQNIAQATAENVYDIAPGTASTYPRIIRGVDDIKGYYQNITSYGSAGVDAMQTLAFSGATVTQAMSQAKSYTITFWANTRSSSKDGSESYIFHQNGTNTPALKWRSDGRMQVYVNNTWYYSDYDTFESNGQWVFGAVVIDSDADTIKFYAGKKNSAVVLAGSRTGTVSQLPTLNSGNTFVLNGWTNNGSDKYAGYDMDEFRIYSSTSDNSGALTQSDLETIRNFDINW